MALNTIHVSFNGQNETITKKRYQYDKGQVCVFDDIELPEAYKVIFSNDLTGENSIPMIGDENGVKVPDDFFLTGLTIYGWIYLSEGDDDGQTVKHFTIPVEKRVRETDEEPTPEEQTEIEQLIVALNGAVNTAETAAENAGNSARQAETAAEHYPIIEDGYWYVWDVDEEEYVSTGIKALGEDGTSPTVTVSVITGGHKVTITDVDGDHVFNVMDGTDGNGIQGIAKTSTVGNVDTYTITYTNGTTTTFTVTNGITPTVDDALSPTSTNPVQNKVIDAKIGDLKAEINNKIDKPQTAGTSGQVLTSDGQGGQSWQTPTVDSALSPTSENPVQNKVISSEVDILSYPYSYSEIEVGGVDNVGVNNSATNRVRTKGFIPVFPGAKVRITYSQSDGQSVYCSVSFYDVADYTAHRLSNADWILSGGTVTVPSGAKYLRAIFKRGTGGTATMVSTDVFSLILAIKASEMVSYNMKSLEEVFSMNIAPKVGTFDSNGIESSSTTTRLISDGYMPVTPGQILYVSWDEPTSLGLQVSMSFYAVDDYVTPRISYINYKTNGSSFTVPANVKYARMIWRVGSAGTATLPITGISNIEVSPQSFPNMIRDVVKNTRNYILDGFCNRVNIDIEYLGDIEKQQAFCIYDNKYYSTNGSQIAVQNADFTVSQTVSLSTGHANSMQIGALHPDYAYISGWNDNKIYIVDLDTLTLVDTITLPTTGYTTSAIDDLNGMAYIFQRDTNPSSANEHYNFIVYDYINDEIKYQTITDRAFGAMQACDYFNGRIIVANGLGKASGIYNYYLVYDKMGSIVEEIFLPQFDSKEPEGIFIDRSTWEIYLGIQIQNGGQNLYKLKRRTY